MKLYDIFREDAQNVHYEGLGLLRDLQSVSNETERNTLEFVIRGLATARHREPTIVDISDISRWMMEVSPQEVFSLADFPNLAPAWPVAWFEHSMPTRFNVNGRWEHQPQNRHFRVANFLEWREAPAGEAGWDLTAMQLWYDKRRPDKAFGFAGATTFFVKPNGEAVPMMPDGTRIARPEADNWNLIVPGPVMNGSPERRNAANNNFRSAMYPVLMAISLLHCKNVATVDHATPSKVAAKRRKAGKPVGVTYKTLVVDGMKEVLRSQGGSHKNGLKKAMHICRGHFATYTDDKPLFGKVTGTFWRPMHTRGSKKRGEVKKDYKVIAGE